MAKRGGIGGAAGEQGSLHRNGVAAYLAVYGLMGSRVAGRSGAIPVRLHLEAEGAVDDIVCTMEDGSKWYIQSKRTAGKDAQLRSAVQQWVAQDLQSTDKVVLASREFRGLLRDLQPLIDQVAGERAPSLGKVAQQKVDEFVGVLKEAAVEDAWGLTKQVMLLSCAVETPSDSHYENAVAMLSGAIVDGQHAPAAFEALRNFMQHSASRREWTTLEDWASAISAAGIPVYSDPEGARGARAEADRQFLAHYRESVAERLDKLDLSALKPGLGLVHVEGLLRGWSVELENKGSHANDRRGADLWDLVRRNPRFVVTGHPGVGKSEALRQVAAAMAADPEAPIPVFVDLREVLAGVQRSEDMTLDMILKQPSRSAPCVAPELMSATLRKAVLAGSTVLIVDGLDEAHGLRGAVAEGLNQLLLRLPTATGFILSTRPSAVDAVRGMGLPTVELRPPERLRDSLKAILRLLAEEVEDQIAREAWLADRFRILAASSTKSKEIWKVPLLATLATLRIGSKRAFASTAVELLNDVVADSVTAWEELKRTHRDGLDSELRSEMLLDGFVAIGWALSESSSVSVQDAAQVVGRGLSEWGFSKRLVDVLAQQIVHFWDERVGVFVDHDGYLLARSRQFAELADALWVVSQADERKHAWLTAAVGDADRTHAIFMATARDPLIRGALIDLASRGRAAELRSRAVALSAQFWGQWADLDEPTAARLIQVLGDAAEDLLTLPSRGEGIIEVIDRARRQLDGGGWHCVVSLANADLPTALREARRERLAGLSLSGHRHELIELLIRLHDAHRERRRLTDVELAAVEHLLYGARPSPTAKERGANGASSYNHPECFISGVDDVVRLAVHHVEEFGPGAPDAFFSLARNLPMSVYEQVERVLRAKGFHDSERLNALGSLTADLQEDVKDFFGLGWILRLVAGMHSDDADGTPVEMWRNRHVADFVSSLDWVDTSIGALRAAANEDPDILKAWFEASIEAFQLDGTLVSTQARKILATPKGNRDAIGPIITDSLIPLTMTTQVDCARAAQLVRGFNSESEWIVEKTFDLVIDAKCPSVTEEAAKLTGSTYWRSRFLSTIALIANALEHSDWIREAAGGDSAARSGLAVILPQLEGNYSEIARALAADEDATVRHHAESSVEGASVWTCIWCYQVHEIEDVPCSSCGRKPAWF